MDAKLTSAQKIVQHLALWNCTPIRVEYERNENIIQPEQPASNCYLIESGEVRLYHVINGAGARLIDIFGIGDWVGSTAALAQLPTHGKRAVTGSRSVLWSVTAQDLRRTLSQHGDFALCLLGKMARQLQVAWTEDSELLYEDCRLRLIKTLLRYSTSSAAKPVADGVSLHITHAQLAQAIGAARETISLCLTGLRQENMVRTGRNQLTFSPDRLRRLDMNQVGVAADAATLPDSPYPV